MAGINDIVSGFQQGANWRMAVEDRGQERQDRQLMREGRRRALDVEMGGINPDISALYDPYEFSLGKMFKGVFGQEARANRRNRRALRSSGMPTAGEAMEQDVDRMQMYADGGRVRNRNRRALNIDGESTTETDDENTYLGAVRDRAAREIQGSFPRLRSEMREAGEAIPGAFEGWGDASAMERGNMIRRGLWETGSGMVEQLGAAAEDVMAPLAPVGNAALGFLGFSDQPQDEAASANPEAAAAIQASAPAEETTPTASSPAGGGGAATPQRGATPFVGPPSPEQAAAQLGNADIMPDDMPSMNTRDWVEYRDEMVPALMMQGMSAAEAHQEITAMQHQGFLRYGQQAAMMLQAQNVQGAARALKAAYQYFPNGADVKFGYQGDNLVAYATDEETGEPTGTPQVISPEYLASMMTNFQDPTRYLAWTKDWRDERFRQQEYEETTKPLAQSTIDYRNESLDISRQNADAATMRALRTGSEGGLSASEIRQQNNDFMEMAGQVAMSYGDADDTEELGSAMALAWRKYGLQPNVIVERIKNAYMNGNLDAVRQLVGQ